MSRRMLWDLVAIALVAGGLAAAFVLLRHGLFTMVPVHVQRVVAHIA